MFACVCVGVRTRVCVCVCVRKVKWSIVTYTHTHYGFCVTHSTEKPSNPHWKLCLWCRSSNTYVCTFWPDLLFRYSFAHCNAQFIMHTCENDGGEHVVRLYECPCVCMCDLLAKTFYFSVFCLTFKLIAFKWLGATVKRLLTNERFTMFDNDNDNDDTNSSSDSSHDTTQPPPTPHSRPHFKLLTHRNGWLTNERIVSHLWCAFRWMISF